MSDSNRNQRSQAYQGYKPTSLPEYSLGYHSSYQDLTQSHIPTIIPPQYQVPNPQSYVAHGHQNSLLYGTGRLTMPSSSHALPPLPQPQHIPTHHLSTYPTQTPSTTCQHHTAYTQDDNELIPLVHKLFTSLLRPAGSQPTKPPVFEGWEFRSAFGDCVTGTWTRYIDREATLSVRSTCASCGRGRVPHDDYKCQSDIVLEGPVWYGPNHKAVESPHLWTISHQAGTPHHARVDCILDEVLGYLDLEDAAFAEGAPAQATESYRSFYDSSGERHVISVFRAHLRPEYEEGAVRQLLKDGPDDRYATQNLIFKRTTNDNRIMLIGSRYDTGIMVQLHYDRMGKPTRDDVDVKMEVAALVLATLYNRRARLQIFPCQ